MFQHDSFTPSDPLYARREERIRGGKENEENGGCFLFLWCVLKSQSLSCHKVITLPISLTFFVSKESYKETASLLKKDYYLLPSLKSFFKGDGCADGSFGIVEKEKTG